MSAIYCLIRLLTLSFVVNQCKATSRYLLYHERKNQWHVISPDGGRIDTLWQHGKDVKVLVHGFHRLTDKNKGETPATIINNQKIFILGREYNTLYKKLGSAVNIIVVDWTKEATYPILEYLKAAENTYIVGKQIANFLINLKKKGYINNWNQVHMLGHSLGAHCSGVTGYAIQQLQNGEKIGRITGLDPAGPGFTLPNHRWPWDMTKVLDFSDAAFVDSIHTNMATTDQWILEGALGSYLATAHVDFFPNGGRHMPQCDEISDRLKSCSHGISVLYFAFALKHHNRREWLQGCPCASYFYYTLGLCQCNHEKSEVIGHFTTRTKPEPRREIYLILTNNISKNIF